MTPRSRETSFRAHGAARGHDKREDTPLTSPAEQFNQRTIDEFRASHGRVGGTFASKAGSDTNPGWYWNLKATPDAAIEVGDETIAVRATELAGAERDEKYRLQSERHPGFAGYQQKTSRTIPVIALTPRDTPAPDLHQ